MPLVWVSFSRSEEPRRYLSAIGAVRDESGIKLYHAISNRRVGRTQRLVSEPETVSEIRAGKPVVADGFSSNCEADTSGLDPEAVDS
jgi:hypothetical protein